ncbi:MAG: filamentous hemagglutinin family protein [Gammaproteobacteria bacterium]
MSESARSHLVRAHVSSTLRQARSRRHAPTSVVSAATVAAVGLAMSASAAELPVPCIAGNCGPNGPSVWVSAGAASATVTADTLRVNQTTDQAILNWASFNVGPDGHVIFQQPNNTSVALNRIFQESPSSIFGRVDANGQIYLVNPNGFIFGAGAKVNAAGILASTLGMTDDVFKGGLLSPNAKPNPDAALAGDGRINVMDANGQPVLGADGQPVKVRLQVQEGAQLTSTGSGGRVLLAGQEISNAGTLSSPDGQVIMAAGQKVYLQASTDPALRGLLVEVDAGGKAWNQLTGQLNSARGNITMTGLAVNQEGRISASTTVSANGSIRLLAQDTIVLALNEGQTATVPVATRSGTLEIGSHSRMEVLPELDDKAIAVEDQKQLASSIELAGHQIHLSGGSRIRAPGGTLTAKAIDNPHSGGSGLATYDAAARIHVDSGAFIDLSGSDATLPMSRNLVSVELRANELKDSPDQRDGALRGKTVVVDARVGTPLGDVSGALAAVPKSIAERTSAGGKATFLSTGDIVVADNASIDISGGTINYLGGTVATSQLITASGQLVDIGQADPARTYVGVLSPTVTVKHDKWGVIESRDVNGLGHYESGYVQGRDAGTLQFASPQMVLNGTFSGHTHSGPYQRDAANVPSGGRLIVGLTDAQQSLVAGGGITNVQYLAPSVLFSDTKPGIVVGDDASIPSGLPLTLSTDYLKNGGFTDTEIYSDSGVTLPADTPLHLADGSSLKIRAPLIDIAGSITALGGNIDAATALTQKAFTAPTQKYGVNVADGVTLDVRGTWTNDVLTPTGVRAEQPIFKDGGSIKLAADTLNADLSIGSDTQFLATGGAWMNSSTKLSGGRGGNITFSAAGFESALTLGENVALEAFGVAGAAGGAFTLNAGRISVGTDTQWARRQSFSPRDTSTVGDGNADSGDGTNSSAGATNLAADGFVHVGSALFDQYGFSAINLAATGARRGPRGETGDDLAGANPDSSNDPHNDAVLIVESGTLINARADSLQLGDRSDIRQSGGVIADFSSVVARPEIERTASKVSLQADARNLLQAALRPGSVITPEMLGRLDIQKGSVLQGDAGSSFSLGNVGAGISVDGSIVAHGGTINMLLSGPSDEQLDAGFLPDLRLELGSSALLDVSGKAVLAPNDLRLLKGNLLNGGSVSLLANRGSVVMQAGSAVDVSGVAAQIDVPTDGTGAQYSRQLLASSGGSVSIRAPESIGLAGTLRAGGGQGANGAAPGGAFSLGLTRAEGFSNGIFQPGEFPAGPRIIEVAANGVTGTIPSAESGLLRIDQKLIDDSGFDALKLTTDGQIRFDDGVRLQTAARLELYSPELVVGDGASVHLASSYVALGNPRPVVSGAMPTPGTGTLDVAADFLELIGSTVLQGVDHATLTSQTDIRLRNSVTENNAAGPGAFSLAGDLTLAAQRIYPATGTTFDITAAGGEHNRITLAQIGTSAGNPLSAGGKLRISADEIVQAGTLLAPFGSIELTAKESLTLAAGSLTSVSGAGQLVPYGQTQNDGKQWVYGIEGTLPAELKKLPDRQVTLSGPSVELAEGSVVDVSGGGDLYAYEFVPGTGGSQDRLGSGVDAVPGLYAVMPSMRGQYAPYDPAYADPSLKPGDSIYLSGVPGLPDGFYPLLPARYALLPGAFLVRSVSGFADLQPGTPASLANGTQVISGYRTFANTPLPDARYSGFEVHPGSYGRALAEYRDSFASKFFGDDSAHPADSGRLTLLASSRLSALGQVKTAAAKDGIGAAVDVSAENLRLVAHSDNETADGSVQIGADVLNSWNPSRLLLGGRHSADGKSISVEAATVSVDTGVDLTLPEILMTGRDSISVHDGARISTTSGAGNAPLAALPKASSVKLTGTGAEGAAFLALSDLTSVIRDRTPNLEDPTGGSGSGGGSPGAQVNLDAGSQLRSRGSLTVDAPGGGALLGDVQGAGASWSLASDHLVFGDPADANAPAAVGLALNPTLVTSLQQAGSLRLESSGSIDFETPLSLGTTSTLKTLTLIAQSLKNLSGDQSVTLSADRVSLQGVSDDSTATPSSGGQGSLKLQANTLEVSDRKIAAKDRNPDGTEAIPQPPGNTLVIEGFGATSLTASRDIIGRGEGSLVVGGDLNMNAARFSAGAASDNTFNASGNVSLVSSALPAGVTLAPLALGGSLSFFGNSINDAANIVVASGNVRVQAASDLTLAENAIIDVAGRQVTAGGREASSAGGLIQLSSGTTLTAAAGSLLDVSGAEVSNAGALVVNAGGAANLDSKLLGTAGTDARGGSFQLGAAGLGNFGALNAQLQTGGFTHKQSVHVASGDLRLAAGTHTTAHDVELITDGGAVSIAGEISAPSSDDRSSLRLYGSNDVTLEATGALRADGANGFRPGIIEVGSSAGTVNFVEKSVVSAESLAGDGELRIRASATATDIRVGLLPKDLSHIGSITLESVLAPFTVSDALTDADFDVMRAAAADYLAAAQLPIDTRLNALGKLPVTVLPGIDVRHDGDLTLGSLDLSTWRFGTDAAIPAALTVRATGNITVAGTISDGVDASGAGLDLLPGQSATIRLAAGANLSGADPTAVRYGATSDLKLADNAVIRTGTGDIALTAARDIVFGATSSVYTAGLPGAETVRLTGSGRMTFPNEGGQIGVHAGHDVVGSPIGQSVTIWQPRQGSDTQAARWGTDLAQFKWNVGSLGGGDVDVLAGHDVINLSAAVADSAIVSDDRRTLTRFGGGSLAVSAGNDMTGGMFYVAHGTGVFDARGAVTTSPTWKTQQNDPLGLLLQMGDSRIDVTGRKEVVLEAVLNPTVLPPPTGGARLAYFFTYGDRSAVAVESAGGDVTMIEDTGASRLAPFLGQPVAQAATATGKLMLPASLSLRALTADVRYNANAAATLFPSATGQLELFAGRDVVAAAGTRLRMSDGAVSGIPTAFAPLGQQLATSSEVLRTASAIRHQEDSQPALVSAGRDILNLNLQLAKSVRLTADRDIVDATLFAQNVNPDDLTLISAGRDFKYSVGNAQSQVRVGGPGRLDVVAGREVDLGTSIGITTTGRLENPNFKVGTEGADLTVLAGLAPGVNVSAFITDIVLKSDDNARKLVSYMAAKTGDKDLTPEDAAEAFAKMDFNSQRPFLLDVFFNELVQSGREVLDDPTLGYKRGYAAIDALFPKSRLTDTPNPYVGDISLAFSRIYTLGGGDISLLAPGGMLNVGLANPAVGTGQRPPEQLGIVAQGSGSVRVFTDSDVLVNQSRLFTLLGGDIAVWSTRGNIDAGRGAKTAVSAPPPTVLVDASGNITLSFGGAVAGSGIRTIIVDPKLRPGDVDLIAPAGFVNAGDAGIGAGGNLHIAAARVIGLDNIQVGGTSAGVPPDVGNLGASLSGASGVASSSSNASSTAVDKGLASKDAAPLAQSALSWLDVFVEGFGEEVCKASDLECLNRNRKP